MIRYLFLLILIGILAKCANQTTPTGGPRDQEAPQLIRSSPVMEEKNFTNPELEFFFSELIRLNNPNEQILISPSPGNLEFTARRNRVAIKAEEGWEENTTYTVAFREGVVDLTEGNPTNNLQIAFSTGAFIDSLSISGSLKSALSEQIPQNITVAIFESDTFNIFEHKPRYFTKSDNQGHFTIGNLRSGVYSIYAFEDRNKNLIVESASERFGFVVGQINLSENIDSLTIPLVRVDSRPLQINTVRHTERSSIIYLNKGATEYQITNDSAIHTSTFNTSQNEITIFHELATDSLQINLSVIDSLLQSIDTTFFIKSESLQLQPTSLTTTTDQPVISSQLSFSLTGNFSIPIDRVEPDSIYIQIDSLQALHFEEGDILIDNQFKNLTVTKKLDSLPFSTNATPYLTIGKGFLISINGDSSLAERKPVKINRQAQTGTLIVNVTTSTSHFIVELLNNSNQVTQSFRDLKTHTFHDIPPGNYKLRAIIDINGNGRWDPGNFYNRVQPEPVHYYTTPEETYSIPVRANFELGPYRLSF